MADPKPSARALEAAGRVWAINDAHRADIALALDAFAEEERTRCRRAVCNYEDGRCNSSRCPCARIRALGTNQGGENA